VREVTDAVDGAIRRKVLPHRAVAKESESLRSAREAMAAEVRALSSEVQERFVRELTEAIDGGIRRRVAWLDATAGKDTG